MSEWKSVPMREITNITDFVANGSFESLRLNVNTSTEPGFAILARLVDHNAGWKGPFSYVDEASYNFLKKSRLSTGDVVISNVGANAGTVFRIPDLDLPVTLGPNSVVCHPLDSAVLDRSFLYYMLISPLGQSLIGGIISGSAQPKFNKTALRQLLVPVPPLQVQHAIAEVLGALDDKIAANTKLAATADDFLAAKLSSLLCSAHEEVRLGDVADVNSEAMKPESGGSLRYVDIASVGVGTHDFPAIMSWDDAPSRARRRLRKGDTIWSTVRPNRRSHSLNLSADPLLVASTGLAVLSPTNVGYAYLYEVTKRPEFIAYLENVAEGSAYPAVRADRFSEAIIPLLPQTELDVFEALAAPVREHIYSLSVENQTLAATRDALLPQLMSGKLTVRS